MKILGLDSSGIVASVAVVEDDILVAEYTVNYKKTHSQTLLPMLDEIAKMTELDLNTIDAIAVAAGPGSFTGLRIGSATAKGLGLALKKPLVAVPTVEGLAYNLYDTQGLICPIMDARRKQVYTGIYRFEDHRLVTVEDQMAVPMEEMITKLNAYQQPVTFLGDGVPVFKDLIAEKLTVPYTFAPAHVNKQRAAAVAALGLVYYKEGKIQTAMEHIPDYLRVSQAERERAEREKDLFAMPWTKEGMFTFLTREDTMFFVVEEKGRILGYCSMQTVLDEGDILNVAVRSDRQKEGIGYFLVDSMLMLAQAQGISLVHLEVRESNGTARRLYQRLGFVEDGLRKNYYTDPLENAVLMTKKQ